MSKRFNNKGLLILLAGLIILLLLTLFIRIPKESASLKSELIVIDTSDVSKIIIYHGMNTAESIEFIRASDRWTVKQGSIESASQKGAVQSIFSEALEITPLYLAATNKSKWEEFELTDSLATRIKFLDKNGKNLADLLVGKFSYKQQNSPYAGNYANNIQGTSYVRLYGEKEVYAVNGFISFFFKRDFEDWRDKTFIYSNKNDLMSVEFKYPADSSFRLSKRELTWFAGEQLADSLQVEKYLNTLSNLNGQEIKDNYNPVLNPDLELRVEGNNLVNFTVKCYNDIAAGEYILNSSLNPEVYFISKAEGIFGKIFLPRSYFLDQTKKIK